MVFTGAGVSTESGIPDFRSPGGIWTRYAPIDYSDYLRDPDMRRESWRRGLHTYPPMAAAQPNAAHLAIAEWFAAGLINGVVTQNIDGLHQRAGRARRGTSSSSTATRTGSLACGARRGSTAQAIHARVEAGEADPACPRCGGMLKAATVSFGQPLPLEAIEAAQKLHASARLCLVIGSSLVVYPAATLPEVDPGRRRRAGHRQLHRDHLDRFATLLSREPAAAAALLAGETSPAPGSRYGSRSSPA